MRLQEDNNKKIIRAEDVKKTGYIKEKRAITKLPLKNLCCLWLYNPVKTEKSICSNEYTLSITNIQQTHPIDVLTWMVKVVLMNPSKFVFSQTVVERVLPNHSSLDI